MKAIVTTPLEIKLSYMVIMTDNKNKLEDTLIYKALNSKGKHLFIEYDECNNNLLKQCFDLDAMGLSHITTVEELEKYFPKPYTYAQIPNDN